jgi:hypothetical protein
MEVSYIIRVKSMATVRMFEVISDEFKFSERANLLLEIMHNSGTLKYNIFINILISYL